MDKIIGTFLSATELLGLDAELHCADPIRASISYSMIHRLSNVPNTYQTSHSTKCHLPKNMTWPSMERSHEGALSLKTLGEYCAALQADILHSVEKFSYPTPQVENMIKSRLEFQNAVSTT